VSKIFDALSQTGQDVPVSFKPAVDEVLALEAEPQTASRRLEEDMDSAPFTPLPTSTTGTSERGPAVSVERNAVPYRIVSLSISRSDPVFPFEGTHPYASEQYRMIRTRILHHPSSPKMIAISSAMPGDGKTTTATNLSAAFALKMHAATILVDSDIRCSAVHRQLGIPEGPGLADVLQGRCALQEAIVRIKELPNLHILTAGTTEANPAELLDSPSWKTVCEELKARFDYVLFDCVPVRVVADFELVQEACEALVLVVRADHTAKLQYKRAIENIAKEKLIGIVMNCATKWLLWRPSMEDSYHARYLGRQF
jgi:capsular exopolysaccharide synthesis family protein